MVAQQKLQREKLSDYYTWIKAVWTTARGNPLEFFNRPYLIDIYKDQFPSIIYIKAAQMGLSEKLLSEAIWVCDQLNKNVLYSFPNQSQLQDLVQARLDPVISNSDYFISRVESANEKVKDVAKLGLKRIGRGFLYLRGSQNPKQITSIDVDMVVLDERDRFDQDNVAYIDKRTLASDLKWRREASTPTLPGFGIHKAYLESDQRIWEVECTECGFWQDMDFFKNVDFERKIAICRKCKEPIDRLKDGRWRAQKESDKHGYAISGLVNPRKTIEELITEYTKAKLASFSDIQQFFNQILGAPYDVEGQSLSIAELNACKKNYYIPMETSGDVYAGVDVGNHMHHVTVLQKIDQTNYRIIYAGTVAKFFGPVDSIESILRKYNVKLLVIDKRPEVTKVSELIEMFPSQVFAAEYPSMKFSVQEYSIWDDIKHEVLLDRTISIDYLIADIQNQRIELPQNIENIQNFYDHLRSSIRITEKNPKTGVEVARWVEKSPDHFLHSLNYARMAQTRGIVGEALLNYYDSPKKVGRPDFIDWLRVNALNITKL